MNFEKHISNNFQTIADFAANEIKTNPNYDKQDFWAEFNSSIDLQLSENDDSKSPNFGKAELWAYPIIERNRGQVETDTSVSVLVGTFDDSNTFVKNDSE